MPAVLQGEIVTFPLPPDSISRPRDPESALPAEPGDEAFSFGDPLKNLVDRWVSVACRHVRLRWVEDSWIADVVGVEGAWASAPAEQQAIEELRSVLEDWVWMKIEDGDTDIPDMEGIRVAPGE